MQLDSTSVQITDVTMNAEEEDSQKMQINVKYCTFGMPIFLSGLVNQCTSANFEAQAVSNLTTFEVTNFDFGELFGVFSTIAHWWVFHLKKGKNNIFIIVQAVTRFCLPRYTSMKCCSFLRITGKIRVRWA